MLKTILQDFADLMKSRVLEITAEFEKNLDFGALDSMFKFLSLEKQQGTV